MRFFLPLLLSIGLAAGQNLGRQSRPMVTVAVTDARLATLTGNTRPEARPPNDQGMVSQSLALDHMLLQLKRPPEREAAFETYIEELHDPKSANFHKWLTPAQVGELYGPNQADVDKVTSWLQSSGFVVQTVYPSGMAVDFSGTAGQVSRAFHTQIHRLLVNGQEHIANMSDPRIPEALAPVVQGVVSLHDFRPRRLGRARRQFTDPPGPITSNSALLLVPSDVATIYNLTPLLNEGITGKGQTIAVLEDSDFYNIADWTTFRSTFGLAQYSTGSLTTTHPNPSGASSCTDPGADTTFGDDAEAEADAEMATAAAPGATIVVASCADTQTTFGVQIAAQNLVNSNTLPTIMELSYGECESLNGTASNAAYNSAYQQGVAEGISIFVAVGDEGAAGCDSTPVGASNWAGVDGVAVNALASTPYDVAVGGTDFSDTYSNSSSTYWNTSNNSNYGSAKGYIPEIPWNDTCGSTLFNGFMGNSTPTYGASGFCNSTTSAFYGLISTIAASGGPSNCATGNVVYSGDVGGALSRGCAGYAKPSWQAGILGNPNDGVRDLPDVALFASDGYFWLHTYIFCYTDAVNGGSPCDANPADWSESGGTSFAAPVMAGIQALVNQKTGSSQGLPNYYYYKLAAAEYGTSGSSSCNSSHGIAVDSSCIFYDITLGDINVPCVGKANCFDSNASFADGISYFPGAFSQLTSSYPSFPNPAPGFPGAEPRGVPNAGTYGVLSTANSAYAPAYSATTGWDYATGIGSVNAYNLANAWSTITAPPANRQRRKIGFRQ
ncbi:MAG TPA: protease pro-enzyme activation domain-containing protein [Bryobacteraceae bacterium]|jgi:subtilase family serine protease|nr:protease pro-enzyme activation domain-containing protein [Bryobacteraceae bacterium]